MRSSPQTFTPPTYFREFAQNNNVSTRALETTVKPTQVLMNWTNYSREDLPGDTKSITHVASLAIEFGAMKPFAWGMPVDQFSDIVVNVQQLEMEGDISPVSSPTPMNTRDEPDTINRLVHARIEHDTLEKIDLYQRVLRASQSIVIRHCMGVAFRMYDEDTFHDRKATAWNRQTQAYLRRFQEELDGRVEYAREHLNMVI